MIRINLVQERKVKAGGGGGTTIKTPSAPGALQGAMADLHLVKEIEPNEMNVPIRNNR